jgi:hypothetical protein
MAKKPVLTIDKPQFIVKLYEDVLEVDLKEGIRKELENVVEAHPILRDSLGLLFQTIIPLDVALSSIDSVKVDDKGYLKVMIPLRRDILIPLEHDESEILAEKLNELIPLAKLKAAERERKLEELEGRPKPRPSETE